MGLPRLIKWILATGLIFLIVMTLCRLATYIFFDHRGYPLSTMWPALLLGFRFDLRLVCIVMLVMLVLGSFRPLNPFRNRVAKISWDILLGLFTFIFLFFYIVDFGHYAYLRKRLNATILNYLQDLGISWNMVTQSYPVIPIVIALIIGTVFLIWIRSIYFRRIANTEPKRSKAQRIIFFILFFLLLAAGIFGRFNQYPLRWSDAFRTGNDYNAQLALNPFESFFNTLRYRHSSYDLNKVKEFYPVLAPYFNFRGTPENPDFKRSVNPVQRLNKKPNVILVICESFSAYKSSMWGNPLNSTPYFNQLCKEGMFFDHCFTPSYGTARGVWAAVTGIPDVELANTASRNPDAVNQHSIINDLNGYEKFYFIGGSASWANIRGLLTNNIKNLHLYEQEDFKAGRVDVWGVSDKNLFLESNKILSQQQQPFFAIIQTADNHRPYTIPKEDQQTFQKRNVPKDSLLQFGFESNEEFNAFRYTDFCYQTFIESAKQQPYFNNTIFVFIGDHGIPGNASKMFPRAWTEQVLISEHVPLLFYGPGLIKPGRTGKIASQIDVLPTIASICGQPFINSALGRDLTDSSLNGKDFAFIFDPETLMIGVVNDSVFYRINMQTKKHEIVSIRNDSAVHAGPGVEEHLRTLTEGMLETSRYLLLNNKKP